ncbi:speckle-type POZ protein-like B [Caerostris extrusa]|uniref:Speckle-type POZ protein-like B n=1 Tax=Caerostris extrusa TaxID=172846 RepID=A0AAV4Y6D5_CAEEX|nr:speckle-type POZ protein-like B [Caerostris extrusa]
MGIISNSIEYSNSMSSVRANKHIKKADDRSTCCGFMKSLKNIYDELLYSYSNGSNKTKYDEKKYSFLTCPSRPLKIALKRLLEDGILSDVCLRVGNESFPVHKSILSSRSPVFKNMFNNDMKEDRTIDISDLDAKLLGDLLLFMYTETVEDLRWESASDLFKASHLYQMMDLAKLCSTYLADNLCKTNVHNALSMSEKFSDENLKLTVQQFISDQSK